MLFDGDSDRILYKSKSSSSLLDGNDLMALYSKCLLLMTGKLNSGKVIAVGSILMNNGLKQYLKNIQV